MRPLLVAVVGADGMLGRELCCQLTSRPVNLVRLDMPVFNITDRDTVMSHPLLRQADVVFNCAAYTDVERAEAEEELAMNVNSNGVRNLAELVVDTDAWFCHLSTDYVFDGRQRTPYLPDAHRSPLSAYGRSKLAGERELERLGLGRPDVKLCLVRTAWMYGSSGRNFVRTVLERERTGESLAVVADQYGSPTLARDLVQTLLVLAERGSIGTYHFTNAGVVSWYDLAVEVLRQVKSETHVEPLTTVQAVERFGLRAKRPAYSVLDCTSITGVVLREPRVWSEALCEHLTSLGVREE